MKKYQKYFNKKLGYRDDYQASFWYYINQIQRKYFVYWYMYSNKGARREDIKDPRGGYTGKYRTVTQEKATYESYSITLFWYTPFAIKFQFNWSSHTFFKCDLTFSILKPSIQLTLFGFSRNTA